MDVGFAGAPQAGDPANTSPLEGSPSAARRWCWKTRC